MDCICGGLGAYVDWNGSTVDPAYEVRHCERHPLAVDARNGVDLADAAAIRVDACLEAIAAVRDLLWPPGAAAGSWSPDTIEAIAARLAFLAPVEVEP